MNIKVFQNRKVSKDYFDNEGTQNENYSTTLSFEVPLGYEDFSKRIVFITEDGNFWDYIKDNEYVIKNSITKYENVEAYLWLTKDNQDFRSETFELNFYENQNPDDMTPSEEQLDGYNTLIAELELKVEEVDALKEETLEALEKLKEQQIDYENRFEEINDMLKELKDTNEYQSEIIDQFKNEFDEKEFKGANAHLPDSAELPLKLQPQGNIEQEVIKAVEGIVVEGSSININDVDTNYEDSIMPKGNIEQDTREGYNLLAVADIEEKTVNGVTYSIKNGVLTLNGTSTGGFDIWISGTSKAPTMSLPSGEYTFCATDIKGTFTGTVGKYIRDTVTGTNVIDGNLLGFLAKRTLESDYSSLSAYIFVANGAVFTNYSCSLMLLSGTYTGSTLPPFEQYGAMPSLDFPSEVKGVGSEKEINLVDLSNPEGIGAETDFVFAADVLTISTAGGSNQDVNYDITNVYLSNPGKILKFQKEKMTQTASGFDVKLMIRDAQFNDTYVSLKDATHTIPTDVSNVFSVYLIIYATTGTSTANTVVLTKPMLCFYDGTDKIYTPYSRCKYDITVENNNIFNKEKNYSIGPYYYDNNTKLVSIRTISSTYTNYRTYNLKLKPNTTYSATLKNLPFNDSNDLHRIMLTNNNDILQKIVVDNQYVPKGIEQIYTFTTGTEDLKLWLQTTADIDVVEKIQLEIGEPTNYIEHQEQNYSIDIPVGQVWYSGKPYKENGKWYRTIEYKKEYLSGKLIGRTATNTNGKYRFGFDLDNAYRTDNATEKYSGYCNLLKQGTRDNTYSLIPCICNVPATSNSYGTGGVFYMEETSQMTTQQANEYITEKGMYVVYKLAEPYVEEITDTTLIEQLEALQKAELYEGVTNVNSYRTSEDVANMPLSVRYNFITPSPSIDRPSEVKGVSGHYDTVVENKNIWNGVLETGSLLNGINEDTNREPRRSKDFRIIKPNTNYAFSINGTLNRVVISLYDKDKNFISNDGSNGINALNGLFTTYANAKYLRFRSYNDDKTLFETGKIQIEENTVATNYVEHQEQLLPIDIPTGQVWYSGKPYKENGKWYRPIEWIVESFNTFSSANVFKNTTYAENNIQRYTFINNGTYVKHKGASIPCLCTHFKNTQARWGTPIETGFFNWENNNAYGLDLPLDQYDTVNKVVELLNGLEDFKIVTMLQTPIQEEITDTTLIEQQENMQRAFSYYPVTNVNSYKPTVNVADLILNGKYYVSNKAKFKTLEERVSALENETVNE